MVVWPDGKEPSSASARPGAIGGRLRSIISLPRPTVDPRSSTAEAQTSTGATLRRTQLTTAPSTSSAGPITENVPNQVITLKTANTVLLRWSTVKSRTAPSSRSSGLWRTTPTMVTTNASSATPPHPATWVTHRGRWLIRPGYPGRLAPTRRTGARGLRRCVILGSMTELVIRPGTADDYPDLIGRVDEWWGGQVMSPMLPRVFFEHFGLTCLVADDDGARIGFLCGLLSASDPSLAYVHFVGVDPDARGKGVGRRLYETFFVVARASGRTKGCCVTAPTNATSIAFHRRLGFTYDTAPTDPGQPLAIIDHDGPGQDRVVLFRAL